MTINITYKKTGNEITFSKNISDNMTKREMAHYIAQYADVWIENYLSEKNWTASQIDNFMREFINEGGLCEWTFKEGFYMRTDGGCFIR